MTFYHSDPHISDFHLRAIYQSVGLRGHMKRMNPITRGPFGKPERRKGRVWLDERSKTRGPHQCPRITIVVCK